MKKTVKKPFIQIVAVFVAAFLLAETGNSFTSINETGELISDGTYRIGVAPQLLLSSGGGSNVGVFFDMYADEDINARFTLGSGDTDFWTSASAKWIPYPDYQKQPAIGLKATYIYARENSLNSNIIQVTPIVSKKMDSKFGPIVPYAGLPVNLTFANSTSTTSTQLAIGTEWHKHSDFQIGVEFDLNLSKSNTALSLYLNYPFGESTGFRK